MFEIIIMQKCYVGPCIQVNSNCQLHNSSSIKAQSNITRKWKMTLKLKAMQCNKTSVQYTREQYKSSTLYSTSNYKNIEMLNVRCYH